MSIDNDFEEYDIDQLEADLKEANETINKLIKKCDTLQKHVASQKMVIKQLQEAKEKSEAKNSWNW